MVESVNNSGYSYSSNINSYGARGNQNENTKDTENKNVPPKDYNETQVDPSKVMDFLANNNFFIAAPQTTEVGEVDAATQDRIAGYMEQFEMIYGIVQEEFGEEYADRVMNLVMNKLMGME